MYSFQNVCKPFEKKNVRASGIKSNSGDTSFFISILAKYLIQPPYRLAIRIQTSTAIIFGPKSEVQPNEYCPYKYYSWKRRISIGENNARFFFFLMWKILFRCVQLKTANGSNRKIRFPETWTWEIISRLIVIKNIINKLSFTRDLT